MEFNSPKIDFGSPTWGAVEDWLNEELENTLKRMLHPDATEPQTQQLRGRASLLKQMLGFREEVAAFYKPQNHNLRKTEPWQIIKV